MNLNASMNDVINQDSVGYVFGLSTWGSALALLFVILTAAIIVFTMIKKDRTWAMIPALVLGILGAGIFGTLFALYPAPSTMADGDIYWATEAMQWLDLFGMVFIGLIAIVLPLYIFSMIVTLVIDNKNLTKGKATKSIFSLLATPIIGITIGLLMIPLILLLPHSLWSGADVISEAGDDAAVTIPGIIISGAVGSLSIFSSVDSILAVLVFGTIIGFAIKAADKQKEGILDSSKIFFENLNLILIKYIGFVIYLVPFAIASKLATIAMSSEAWSNVAIIGYYSLIFSIGAIIIYAILFTANLFMSDKTSSLSRRERAKILANQSLIAFTNQSTILTLPYTQEALEKLGSDKETRELTTASGTVMGMIMCNGYSPLMIMLFSAMYYNHLTFATVLITITLILLLGVSASGSGSADYTIILATLGTLGLSTSFYLGVLMPIQEVNEKIYPTVNNTAGHMFATQLSERLNNKK